MSNPLTLLTGIVVVLAALSLVGFLRKRPKDELPMLGVLLALIGLGVGSLVSEGERSLSLSLACIFYGLLILELPGRLSTPLLLARLKGRRRRARFYALLRLLFQPTTTHRTEWRIQKALFWVESKRWSEEEAHAFLSSASYTRTPLVSQRLSEATLELLVNAGGRLPHVFASLSPAGLCFTVELLCREGRLREAREAFYRASSLHTETIETGLYYTRARIVFLSWLGFSAFLRALSAQDASLKKLFSASEWERLFSRGEAPLDVPPDVFGFAREQAEVVRRECSAAYWPFRPRWMSWCILALCVALFVLPRLGVESEGELKASMVRWGAIFLPALKEVEVFRFFASLFLHANLLHLALNMGMLFYFGRLLEGFVGFWRFLLLYLLSGLTASLAIVLWGASGIYVGASGAIFGMIGAGAVFSQRRLSESPLWYPWHLFQTIFVAVVNLFLGFTLPFVSNVAHLGGLLGGVLFALLFDLVQRKSPRLWSGLRYIAAPFFLLWVVLSLWGALAAR